MSVPGQIVSPLWLFAQGAQPLDSSYSAHNVHNALGNCFFPLPLKSHHFTRLSASVLLFIFKGLNQDKYSWVKPSRPTALCARLRSALKICWADTKLFQLHEGAGRMWMGLREGEKSWWWDWLRSCPDWGLQQGSLSFGQLFAASKAGRRVSVKSYNNREYNHPLKTQLHWSGEVGTSAGRDGVSLLIQGKIGTYSSGFCAVGTSGGEKEVRKSLHLLI